MNKENLVYIGNWILFILEMYAVLTYLTAPINPEDVL